MYSIILNLACVFIDQHIILLLPLMVSEDCFEQIEEGDNDPEDVSEDHMFPREEFAPGRAHPPNIDHCVVATSFVIQVIKDTGNMTMAIVAADVVHASLVYSISLFDCIVILLFCIALKLQSNVLVRLTKCQIINRNIVWTSKIVQDTL